MKNVAAISGQSVSFGRRAVAGDPDGEFAAGTASSVNFALCLVQNAGARPFGRRAGS